MKEVTWEGRLQVLNRRPLVVADGAHNQDSAHKLRQALAQYFKFEKAVLIIGMSSDKDLEGIVAELAPVFRQVIVTKSLHPRAMDTRPIAAEFLKYGIAAQQTDDISVRCRWASTGRQKRPALHYRFFIYRRRRHRTGDGDGTEPGTGQEQCHLLGGRAAGSRRFPC